MPWLAAIGTVVASVFTASAISGLTAMVIGGAIVGAAVGGLYAWSQGDNILKGMLYGAVGGAVLGAGGYVLGLGGASLGGGPAALATTGSAGSPSATLAAWEASQGITTIAKTGASLFTTEGLKTAGTAMQLGSAFLKGGDETDAEADLAFKEKQLEENIRFNEKKLAAEKNKSAKKYDTAIRKIESNERLAFSKLKQDASQFDQEFGFQKYQYEDKKAESLAGKERFEASITDAADYVRGNSKSATVAQISKDRRKLPGPVWYGGNRPKKTGLLHSGAQQGGNTVT